MFNLFGSKKEQVNEAAKVATVEMVHREFFTAQEKLLKEAKDTLTEMKHNKSQRLQKFGFGNTQDTRDSIEYSRKKMIAQTVQKYMISHPMNKVIHNDDVYNICKKYNLIKGTVDRYTGFVPEKNLKEIENFNTPIHVVTNEYGDNRAWGPFKTLAEAEQFINTEQKNHDSDLVVNHYGNTMFICAPPDKMIMYRGDTVVDHVIVPDPIVLYPVENGCYLIVTAWGDEASDPQVVNEKLN